MTADDRLRTALLAHDCVVVGAAPLKAPIVFDPTRERLVVVNGGISSVAADPDVWVLNSRTGPIASWTSAQRRLNTLMRAQGTRRHVRLVCLLSRELGDEAITKAHLAVQGTSYEDLVCLSRQDRRWLERASGIREALNPNDALSAGLTAAAFCALAHAATIRLEGFSWRPGYHYAPDAHVPSRGHERADRLALRALERLYGARLTHSFEQEIPMAHKPSSRPPSRPPSRPTAREAVNRASATVRAADDRSDTPANPPARGRDDTPITVRATAMGFYELQRRRPGDVFTVPAYRFSETWMERVDDRTPLRTTTISEARRREHQEIMSSRAPASQLQPNAVDPIAPPTPPSPVDE